MLAHFKNVRVAGLAAAVPKNRLDLAAAFGEKYVARVAASTGIQTVRVAPEGMKASDLCARAAEDLFAALNIDRNTIDAVIFVSQTPDLVMPATSVLLQHRLGLSTNAAAFDINYGCSGYLYGLFQGASLVGAGARRALVLAGDVISRHLDPSDNHLRMVLGDAGSATIVETGDDEMVFSLHSDGAGAESLIIRPGAPLHMDGTAVMNFALRAAPAAVEEVLAKRGWAKDEVDTFGLHQANAFMLHYIAKKMRVPAAKVPVSVADVGNTGPASIPLMLAREGGRLPLEKTVLCGFGVGLSWGAATLGLQNAIIPPVAEL